MRFNHINSLQKSRNFLFAILCGFSPILFAQEQSVEESYQSNHYVLWDEFYKTEKSHPEHAEKLLQQLSEVEPDNLNVWKSLTYLYINQKNLDAALNSLNKARHLAPHNEQLMLQEAYLLNSLGRNPEALVIFQKLTQSSNPETRDTATQAVKNLGGISTEQAITNQRTFADIYFSPSYEDRYDIGIFPVKLRAGLLFGDQNAGQIYGFVSANRDTRSQGSSHQESFKTNAIIYDENAIITGIGVNYKPWQTLPLLAYLEVGASYDLIDRQRDKLRESISAGITGYQEWLFQPTWCQNLSCSSTYIDGYMNIASYSREDYAVLADVRMRTGLKFRNDHIHTYAKLHTLHDTVGTYYNNLAEFGPGIAWQPSKNIPLTLRVEHLYGKYLVSPPNQSTQDDYSNTRVEATFYYNF